MTAPRLRTRYELSGPAPMVVELHEPDCDCPACEGMRAGDADPEDGPALRTFLAAGWLALAGAAIGSAIAFAIDAHGAWAALLAVVGR